MSFPSLRTRRKARFFRNRQQLRVEALEPRIALAGDLALTDISSALDFSHQTNGGEGLAGAAWIDYDADNDLDLFLVNGMGHAPALFANDGAGNFTNVTVAAGLDYTSGGLAVVAGDLDNDGFPDLLVTGEGGMMGIGQTPTKLFHNQGDGTFADISATAGVPGPETTGGAAFGDINNDGLLDIFITAIGSLSQQVQHRNALYLNNGDMTFTDISHAAGIDTDLGACAVTFTDYNGDGLQDILVANCNDVFFDTTPFELFQNNGDLTFTNVARQAGLNKEGFWMSVSQGDIDNDGDLDLFSTNTGTALNTEAVVYRNQGGRYAYQTVPAGLKGFEFGWGSTLTDFDNDGDLDLYFAGSLPPLGFIGPGLASPGRLFENDGSGRFTFVDVPVELSSRYTSGVAAADINGDGFSEVVIQADGTVVGDSGSPVLLSATPNDNHWVTIQPVGTTSNRGGVGAKLEISTAGFRQLREVQAGSSFASTETPWHTFGLGEHAAASLTVIWPSGLVEVFSLSEIDRMVTITEGTGSAASSLSAGAQFPLVVVDPLRQAVTNSVLLVGSEANAGLLAPRQFIALNAVAVDQYFGASEREDEDPVPDTLTDDEASDQEDEAQQIDEALTGLSLDG